MQAWPWQTSSDLQTLQLLPDLPQALVLDPPRHFFEALSQQPEQPLLGQLPPQPSEAPLHLPLQLAVQPPLHVPPMQLELEP